VPFGETNGSSRSRRAAAPGIFGDLCVLGGNALNPRPPIVGTTTLPLFGRVFATLIPDDSLGVGTADRRDRHRLTADPADRQPRCRLVGSSSLAHLLEEATASRAVADIDLSHRRIQHFDRDVVLRRRPTSRAPERGQGSHGADCKPIPVDRCSRSSASARTQAAFAHMCAHGRALTQFGRHWWLLRMSINRDTQFRGRVHGIAALGLRGVLPGFQ